MARSSSSVLRGRALCGLICTVYIPAQCLLVIAEEVPGRAPAARGIFPFRLGQQTVALARFSRQPRHIGFSIIPAQTNCRMRAGLRKTGLRQERPCFSSILLPPSKTKHLRSCVIARLRHKGCKLIDRHVKFSDCERFGDFHRMLRSFIVGTAVSLARDPMVKLPAGTTTISGQVSHSLNTSFGSSVRSASVDKGLTPSGGRPTAGATGGGGAAG